MRRWFRTSLYFVLLLVMAAGVRAQDDATPAPTPTPLPVFALGPGSTIEGNIVDAVPVLRYSFEARVGDNVTIQMSTTSGDLDPFLTLLGPEGELIEQDDDSGGERNAAITTTLTRDGTHIIEATRYSQGGARSTGTFRLSLNIAGLDGSGTENPLANVPDFGLDPAPSVIAYQEPGAGTIDDLSQERYFAFGGQQGDLVRVIVATTSGDLVPQVDVLNRSLLSITSSEVQTRPTESIAYATLPETGWYLVRAGRRSGIGSFDLYIDRLVAGAVLAYGDSITGEFTADTPAASYVFNARAGDLIAATLFASEESSGVQPELRLLNISFQSIARSTGSRFATLRTTIPRSGTYILQANNLRADRTGGFNLRLSGNPVDISKLDVDNIGYNERLRGFISSDNPISYYRFSGKAGERVTIEMRNTSGTLDSYLILTDGDLNEELAFNDNVSATLNARIVRYRLEKDGDYLILATRAGLAEGTTQGGFDLSLTVGDIALAEASLGARLSWNSAADLNLFVRAPQGRIVSWSNPGVPSGGTLQIDSNTNCQTPTDQPIEYIFWPRGVIVPGDYEIWAWYQNVCADSAAVPFGLSVTMDGTPIFETGENAPTLQPGQRFEIGLRVTEDGSAFLLDAGQVTNPTRQQEASEGGDRLLVYGDSIQDGISDEVYAHFYQFFGSAGDEIRITAETVSGNLDPVLILRDAGDNNLPDGGSDDIDPTTRDARLTYTLPEDGQYIIAVTRFGVRDGTTTGRYRLTLEWLNPAE